VDSAFQAPERQVPIGDSAFRAPERQVPIGGFGIPSAGTAGSHWEFGGQPSQGRNLAPPTMIRSAKNRHFRILCTGRGARWRKDLISNINSSELLIFLCQFFRDETWRRFMIHEWRESAIPDFL
jgi:hypothetical protein